jgi:hypothetical protein
VVDAVAARPGRWREDISAFADDNGAVGGLKKALVLSSGSFICLFAGQIELCLACSSYLFTK